MAQVDRSRWGLPTRAARLRAGAALRRAAVLAGLAAGGWLLGAGVATADTGTDDVLPGVDQVAEAEGSARTAAGENRPVDLERLPDEADEADEAGDAVAEAAVSDPVDARHVIDVGGAVEHTRGAVERTGGAVERTGGAVQGTVGGAVDATTGQAGEVVTGTGEVVTGTVEAGRSLTDESIGEGDLAGAVSGIGGGTGTGLTSGLGRAVGGELEEGLQRLDGRGGDSTDEDRGTRESDGADGRDDEARTSAERGGREDLAEAPASAGATTGPQAYASGPIAFRDAHDSEDRRITGAPAPSFGGSDSTGTPTSPVPAPTAGFLLQQRADTLRTFAERVSLPGDPTLVTRDAADDPSTSPD